MILYAFYNSDLIDSARITEGELAVGSMDDVALIVTGLTFADCHRKIRAFMERSGGGLEWSRTHNSHFSLEKFGLLNCKARLGGVELGPALRLSNGTVIKPSDHHRFLGVLVNQALKFRQHVAMAYAKGPKLVGLIKRLSTSRSWYPACCPQLMSFSRQSARSQATGADTDPLGMSRSSRWCSGRPSSSCAVPRAPLLLTP